MVLILLPGGCANVMRKTELALNQMAYKPGVQIVATYEETRKKYHCYNYKRAFLEDFQFRPSTIAPGEQVLNRFVYASCFSESIHGKIIRKVLFRGRTIVTDPTDYDFIPGAWAVTAFIKIPPHAKTGDYTFKLELQVGDQRIRKSYPFKILRP